jgi:S-formylglutathione hydrolase FrmB
MPEGGKVGFYSDWRSGPGWETFHTAELPNLLARQYLYGPGTHNWIYWKRELHRAWPLINDQLGRQ